MKVQHSAITFDVDWAPDWAIALCAEICAAHGMPATFFVTHPSDALDEIGRREDVELGIHPNFNPGTTQGRCEEEIVDYCLDLAPAAAAIRTHALVQSTPILALISDRYPQIETDTSVLLFGHDNLQPVDVYYGQRKRRLTRLPYNWEDDVAADRPDWSWSSGDEKLPGLAIYDFHPIHVALNTASMAQYANLRAAVGGKPLTAVTEKEARPFVESGRGALTYLESILKSKSHHFLTISKITEQYRLGC